MDLSEDLPTPIMEMTSTERFKFWPYLTKKSFKKTSHVSYKYNCVAWVLGLDNKIVDSYSYYWPDELPRDHTIDSYALFYNKNGFKRCDNGEYEDGLEKIAIYGDEWGLFKHVALQLKGGSWTSKMGDLEDIEHKTVEAVSGNFYGEVKIYMYRKR